MPFADPSPTQADLHFRLFGFPVRIHPFFWVVCLLLSSSGEPMDILLWTISVLVSILVHELGHAVLQRRFGGRPHIVLYSFGGLAYGNGADDSPRSQILISFAGPLAGFLLAAAVAACIVISGQAIGLRSGVVDFDPYDVPILDSVLFNLLYINLWWGLLNLLPIYPLDGGQIARELFLLTSPIDKAIVRSLWLSIVCAAAVAAWSLVSSDSFFRVLLFGMLAFSNYQTLEAYRNARRGDWR